MSIGDGNFSVSTLDEGSSGPESKNQNPGKTTPKKYSVAKDPRSEKGAGEYPHYWSYKTRSGHNFVMDDSKGNETVTIQHRSGTAIQMHPDGALHITAHNSKYEVTFGENRMTITGAQDITVKGDASLRVYGDYNVTCHKDYNLTVLGDFNMTSRNLNRHIRGNMDTQAKNKNTKLEGSYSKIAHGAITSVAKGSQTIASQGDKVFVGASGGIHGSVTQEGDMSWFNEKGDHYVQNKDGKYDMKLEQGGKKVSILHENGKTSHKSDEEITTESANKGITTKAKEDISTKSTSGGIKMKADAGSISTEAQQNVEVKAQQNIEVKSQADTHIKATGTAAIDGSTTHVGGMSGTTHVVGSSVNVDPGAGTLNLAGGGGIPFSGLNLQMAFDFLNGNDSQGVQQNKATRAEQPQRSSEPDEPSWV
jgi:hypothetical protein